MERKEPTISGTIKPEKDEVAARQGRAAAAPPGGNAKGPKRPGGGGGTPPPPQRPAGASSGGQGLAIAALIIAVAGVGASGFLAWKWTGAEQNLAQANERLETLEKRIAITSNESSEYVEEIQEKLEWADSEIRKLWGVSYDTNRKRIASNQEGLESLKRELASVKESASSASQGLSSLRSAFDKTEQQVSEVSSAIERLQAAADSVEAQGQRLQNLSEEVDQLEEGLGRLRGLAERVGTNEEAIEAIDSYRRSINRDILTIKEQLSSP
ncbi:hypothetical protein EDC38_0098 [Marinimicrobium koreense]|uniref:Uncharacterized protein n=1 Tax=Marinimicrobium koreense TaxID=306545 RepID=A0A3N1NI84_9GAMM|nr:hypothetical protein [Marinimicrobium koreense]ROQ19514.1 hypothetical protein EDC38_0098 [Marinimicrobium koreense]